MLQRVFINYFDLTKISKPTEPPVSVMWDYEAFNVITYPSNIRIGIELQWSQWGIRKAAQIGESSEIYLAE